MIMDSKIVKVYFTIKELAAITHHSPEFIKSRIAQLDIFHYKDRKGEITKVHRKEVLEYFVDNENALK